MTDYTENPLCLVAESSVHGRGLFARHDIPANTWIGHYDGPPTYDNGMHVLWVDEGEVDENWVGYDGNNELRFMNHARSPNGEMDGLDLYALQDIAAGEEITIDYGKNSRRTLAYLDCPPIAPHVLPQPEFFFWNLLEY